MALELPADKSAEVVVARWTEAVLSGERALPQALRLQIACCLHASGKSESLEGALTRLSEAGF